MARKVKRSPVARDKRFKRPVSGESGPPELWQHTGRVWEYTETAGVFAARATEEHVLDHLLLMKLVKPEYREAGLKFHHDYMVARIEERVTASYASVRVAGRSSEARFERNDAQEAAYQRWRNALKPIPMHARDVLVHVCCVGILPRTAQLPALVTGLFHLSKYYGLVR